MYLYLLRRLYTKPVFLKTKTTFRASKSVVVKVIVRYNFRGCKEHFFDDQFSRPETNKSRSVHVFDLWWHLRFRANCFTLINCKEQRTYKRRTKRNKTNLFQSYNNLYSFTCIYDKLESITYYTITKFTKTSNSSSYIIFIFGIRNVVHVYNMMSFAELKSYNLRKNVCISKKYICIWW